MAALNQTQDKPQQARRRRIRLGQGRGGWSVGRLPLKFKETVMIEFQSRESDDTCVVTFETGQIVDDLIVTDFDDFSAILEFGDGWIAFGVPKAYFVAAPNF
jgi:hypothetical protein